MMAKIPATKMSTAIVRAKAKEAERNIHAFIESELQSSKGHRAQCIAIVEAVLAESAPCRRKLVEIFVQQIWDDLRHNEQIKERARRSEREQAERSRAFQKHGEIITAAKAKVREAISKLSPDAARQLRGSKSAQKAFLKRTIPEVVKHGLVKHVYIEPDLRKADEVRARQLRFMEKRKQLEMNQNKAESFDRMVEALDAIQVGQKLLGDCTGADLLREAVMLEELAQSATAQSVFYRQLAGIVGKTTTVRAAADRAGIVGLLTHQFKEEAKLH